MFDSDELLEIWKPIANFPNYEISDMGNVKSFRRKEVRILKPKINQNGYSIVTLCRKKCRMQCRVHRLVALAFIPNPENKPMCNHINGIKTDNRVENIEWSTASENNYHAYKTMLKNTKGERHRNSKLTNNDIIKIRELLSTNKYMLVEIGNMFNVKRQTIGDIKTGRNWSHLKETELISNNDVCEGGFRC